MKNILDRLKEGIVIGDGGYTWALEKRGYVTGGIWCSEASIENPDAVLQLHKEFIRAGSDVIQAYTFYSNNELIHFKTGPEQKTKTVTTADLNRKACQIARQAAKDYEHVLVAGGISQNKFREGKKDQKKFVQDCVREQVQIFLEEKADFIICEYMKDVEEMEWAIEEVKKSGLPIVATLRIGTTGDCNGVSTAECAVRLAKAKADVVGVNCIYDPYMLLDAMRIMKEALDKEGLQPYLAIQPNGFFSTGLGFNGYMEAPEYPFAMESRNINRFDVHRYARAAYELGIRYIGGCCGFEAYHIRAIAEELSAERGGKLPIASQKHGLCKQIHSSLPFPSPRYTMEYWENIRPETGRP